MQKCLQGCKTICIKGHDQVQERHGSICMVFVFPDALICVPLLVCARAHYAQLCVNVHGPLALADPLCCSVSSRHFYSDRPRQTICGGKTIINLPLLVFISLAPALQLTHSRT